MQHEELYSPYRWMILLVGCLALICYGINLVVWVPLFQQIAADLHVGMDACLNLSMVFIVVVAMCVAFGGILVDRYGLAVTYVGGMLCACVPAVLMPALGDSYTAVFVSRLLQGPVAVSFATIGPILALWFPAREQGIAGGLLMCSLSVGTAVGLAAAPALLSFAGTWQATIALASLPGWITLVLALVFARRPPSPAMVKMLTAGMKAAAAGGDTYLSLLAKPITWVGTLIFFCNAWGFYTLYNVVPPYLASSPPMGLGLAPGLAANLSLLLSAGGITAFLLGGFFYDKVAKGSSRPAIFVGFILTGVLTYALLARGVYESLPLLGIAIVVAASGVSFMGPSISGFVATHYPTHLVGSMVGFWFGIGSLGGALGTFMAGAAAVADGNLRWGFVSVAVVSAAGFLLTFALRRRSAEVVAKTL